MNPTNKWLKMIGIVLNVLVAGLIIFAGSMKILGKVPPEAIEQMKAMGVADKLMLIGIGETIAAILLLIPWTAPLGTLAVSGFWGGVISTHMLHNDPFLMPCIFLGVTWIGSYLRGSVPLFACKSCAVQSAPAAR